MDTKTIKATLKELYPDAPSTVMAAKIAFNQGLLTQEEFEAVAPKTKKASA